MRPRFLPSAVPDLAQQYWGFLSAEQREREEEIIQKRAPAFRKRGYLTCEDMKVVSLWKSARSTSWVEHNSGAVVKDVTTWALARGTSEESRIKALTILKGIQFRTASVVLHFGFEDKYPILDIRALWSLGETREKTDTFEFWEEYVCYSRNYIRQHGICMRHFDRALWTYAKKNQRAHS